MTEFEHALLHELREWREQSHHQHKKLMVSLDALTASINNNTSAVTGLTAAVDAAVADINTASPTDAQIAALVSVVDSSTANINAQTARLAAAVNPPVVTPPPVV